MNGDQIRDSFIRFFEDKGHLHMPSASLIPAGDPTLLFTSAGMVPFKPFFTGEQTPPAKRMTSSQKSFRTADIDEVGDHKHLTFFEMLGNFSIGDYFKQNAVAYAWELVTQMFKLDPDRLYVTIHLGDDDAFDIWHNEIGVPPERIYRYGDKDNWWGPAGNEGATGPCSEIHYDGGEHRGCGPMVDPGVLADLQRKEQDGAGPQTVPGCHPNCDCERFVELWNLVFMQFYQDTQGERTPLPAPSVDTGMGLERAAVILQNKTNIYETDLFWPIIQKVSELAGKGYGDDKDDDFALRVVAEHTRAACFLIGDGVVPANEGRGYVLRRVIRRGIRYGRRLGLTEAFLTPVAEQVLAGFGHVYKELVESGDFILRVLRLEEERFGETFERGIGIFSGLVKVREYARPLLDHLIAQPTAAVDLAAGLSIVDVLAEEGAGVDLAVSAFGRAIADIDGNAKEKSLRAWVASITGLETFVLYATYGFPPELTGEMAREHGLEVDMDGFQVEMEAHEERSRAGDAFTGSMEVQSAYESLGAEGTSFVGYQGMFQQTVVAAILVSYSVRPELRPEVASRDKVGPVEGSHAAPESLAMTPSGHATQGQRIELVLQETPFYAEGGGQQGDQGVITGPNGTVTITDTQSPIAGLIIHRGTVTQGEIALGEAVTAQVDVANRLDASRNHSSTHLLHASLRSVLGLHVRQAGSLVTPERLRFDFSHVSALSFNELRLVQGMANEKVRDNLRVSSQETSYAEAVRQGALAFFGDRYGDVVRVVSMGDAGGENAGASDNPFSMEVCGGTHVSATGQVGTLLVLGESSIGGGMRRIEAISGRAAEELFLEQSDRLAALSHKLQTPVAELESRLDSYMQDTEDLKNRLETLERATLRAEAERLLERVDDVDGVKLVAARTSATNPEGMREMGDFLKAKLPSVAVVLAAVVDGNPLLVAMVSPDLVEKGLHAGNLARDTAKVMGGGGGGRPDMAQAGGRQPEKLDDALRGVADLVRKGLAS